MEVIKMNNSETPKKVILDLFDLADISHEPGERQTDLEDLITAQTIKERDNDNECIFS